MNNARKIEIINNGLTKYVKEHREARKRCCAFSTHGNRYYYALSGTCDDKKAKKIVKDLLGESATECHINNTYTILPIVNDYETNGRYKDVEDDFHYQLNRFNLSIQPFDVVRIKRYPGAININNNEKRNWSCAERKIKGMLGGVYDTIYVDAPPCYFCIPSIERVCYLNSNKRIKYLMTRNDRIVKGTII